MRRQMELLNSAHPSIRKTRRGAMERLLIFLWGGSPTQYWPELHYMRGPGPKWLEKHGGLPEEATLAKVSPDQP